MGCGGDRWGCPFAYSQRYYHKVFAMPLAEEEAEAGNPLGKGLHAQAALVTAIALVTSSLHRLVITDKGRYLARGWDWESIPGSNKSRWLAHMLFKVATSTIQRAVERSKKKSITPKKRGPKINSDPISLWPSLYAVISAYVATQRKNGDIVNVHKLAVHLQDETDEGQNRGLTFSYLFCKYWFKKNRVRVRSHPQEGERCKK